MYDHTELGPLVLIGAVIQNIKFSKILLSIILFSQMRIHKKRVSCIPSPLVMSVGPVKTQMSECLVLYKRPCILPLR